MIQSPGYNAAQAFENGDKPKGEGTVVNRSEFYL
jgi:hypothetical protein